MPWHFLRAALPKLTMDACVGHALQEIRSQTEVLRPYVPQGLWDQTVAPLLQRLVQRVWDLPGAAETRLFGMLQQSLELAVHAVPAAPPVPLAQQAFDMLGQCCREQRVRVNQLPGQVCVRDAETLLVVPSVFEVVRRALKPQGVSLPRNDQLHGLYTDLAQAGYVLGPPGQHVVRAIFPRPERAAIRLSVLRVPTALLWPQTPPGSYPGEVMLEGAEEAPGDVCEEEVGNV